MKKKINNYENIIIIYMYIFLNSIFCILYIIENIWIKLN